MKNIFLFCILICHSVAFGQNNDSIRRKIFEEQKKNFDEQCNADKLRAMEDSKTQTIYFVNIPAPNGYDLIQKNELAEILKKDNIEFGGTWMGSDIPMNYIWGECYKTSMTAYAEKKFGKKFFDDKIKDALKIYLERNPDKIFDYSEEELDNAPIIVGTNSYEEQRKFLDNDFWAEYKLPKAYIPRSKDHDYSYIDAFFILDQKGKISQLQTEASIQNLKNRQFKNYFEASLKKFIQGLKFRPQTYQGFKVKSKQNITIFLP